ncbi:hypothetical protein NQ318_017395 [Aromia moschata]|uniref:Uncharacterized protein n=1 Tax=Aromia moschata TaxID=1265417 RepID=A0AAV8Z2F7_9CUCU|nr:hypothetical protein NQ318_017395 [Aromia moschata]
MLIFIKNMPSLYDEFLYNLGSGWQNTVQLAATCTIVYVPVKVVEVYLLCFFFAGRVGSLFLNCQACLERALSLSVFTAAVSNRRLQRLIYNSFIDTALNAVVCRAGIRALGQLELGARAPSRGRITPNYTVCVKPTSACYEKG